jgi:hypothetical protein
LRGGFEVTNGNWTFEELGLEDELEKVREEALSYSAKHELLHEMIREFYGKGDFESDTVEYLRQKIAAVTARTNTLHDVRKYLRNLKNGVPLHVRPTVGRFMTRFGLTEEQSKLFLDIHKSHMAAMGSDNQAKYSLAAVRNVVWDREDDCIKVYYDDIWWHYDRRGQWY